MKYKTGDRVQVGRRTGGYYPRGAVRTDQPAAPVHRPVGRREKGGLLRIGGQQAMTTRTLSRNDQKLSGLDQVRIGDVVGVGDHLVFAAVAVEALRDGP